MKRQPDDSRSRRQLLGVLGGMGPLATADFLTKLVKATPAQRDQDHLPVIVCSFPDIPDRSEAILGGGPSPLPAMCRAIEVLCSGGAERIAIPCNTAHHWFGELQSCARVRILHIVDAVLEELELRSLTRARVAVLGTEATIRCGIYEKRLIDAGYQVLGATADERRDIVEAIGAAKQGEIESRRGRVAQVIQALFGRGADAIVLGCTELPLFHTEAVSGAIIDSTTALARLCVRSSL